jgi:predicted esterase
MINNFIRLLFFQVLLIGFISESKANGVEMSWIKAVVFHPAKQVPITVEDLALESAALPVLIYLHGCAGIDKEHDYAWGRSISKNTNFIVVMPDSMARPGRLSNCSLSARGVTNQFPQAYQFRQEEITFVINQLRLIPSWDKNNLFLMGHSEGGIAVAQSIHVGFNGLVISSWTCTNRSNRKFDGIQSPKDVPILAVAAINDVWRKDKPTAGRCIDKSDGHTITQIDLPGDQHGTSNNELARETVSKFLKINLKR